MWSMDLESRILELAEERGLLEAGASEALGNRDWLSPEALEAASAWGPRLDHLLSRGSLAEEQLQSLAWEAIQAPTPDASLPAPIPEEDPALASRFQGLALLGEGATARVYRAFDTRLQRPVALKRLKSVHGHHRQRLLAEAKAQARVDHPFVCKVYDVWESGGEALIVLQLAEGGTLAATAPLRPREAVAFVRDAALGAHAAHVQGLVHLDLKPGNLLLWRDDRGELRPLLSDFGLGRPEGLRGRGVPMGTPPYSSPEQVLGGLVDRRSDVHALGMVLYVLLTGRFPFEAASFPDLVEALQRHPPLPLRALRPDLPADLEAILSACLARDPRDRYATAQALAEDLDRYLAGLPVAVAEKAWGYRLSKALRRHRALAWTLGAAALAIAASLGWGAWNLKFQADQTRWAAHFDQDIHAWETQFNYIYALPAHDISPDMNRLDAAYEELKARVERGGRAMRGPGHYALARMAQMLYWNEAVETHLAKAVEAGYRTPQVELARAEALMAHATALLEYSDSNEFRNQIDSIYFKKIKLIIINLSGQTQVNENVKIDILRLSLDKKYDEAIQIGETFLSSHPWDSNIALKICELYSLKSWEFIKTNKKIRMDQIVLQGKPKNMPSSQEIDFVSNCKKSQLISEKLTLRYPSSPSSYHALSMPLNILAIAKVGEERTQNENIDKYKKTIEENKKIWSSDPWAVENKAIIFRAIDVPNNWSSGRDISKALLELDHSIKDLYNNKYIGNINKLRLQITLIYDKLHIISTFGQENIKETHDLLNFLDNDREYNLDKSALDTRWPGHLTLAILAQKMKIEWDIGADSQNSIDAYKIIINKQVNNQLISLNYYYPRIIAIDLKEIEMNSNSDFDEVANLMQKWEKEPSDSDILLLMLRSKFKRLQVQLGTSDIAQPERASLTEIISTLESREKKTSLDAVTKHQLLLEKGQAHLVLASTEPGSTAHLDQAIADFRKVRDFHPWSTEAAEFLGEACRLRALCGTPDRRLLLQAHDWAEKALHYAQPLSEAEIRAGKRRPFPPWRLEWPHQGRSLLVRGHVELDLARTAPQAPERLRWARTAQATLEASLRLNKNLAPKLQPLLDQARTMAAETRS